MTSCFGHIWMPVKTKTWYTFVGTNPNLLADTWPASNGGWPFTNNLYCAKTLNIVLSFVIDVHFVMVVLLVFSKMWRFPYPFGFCNPVWIYRRKINDDDEYVVVKWVVFPNSWPEDWFAWMKHFVVFCQSYFGNYFAKRWCGWYFHLLAYSNVALSMNTYDDRSWQSIIFREQRLT